MAFEDLGKCITREAASDLSAAQYYLVTVNTSGQLALCGDGAMPIGVLQDAPAAQGRGGLVCIDGVSKVILGGTVTAADQAGCDSAGKAVNPSTGDSVFGKFLESGVSGDIVSVLLKSEGVTAAS